MQFKKPDEKTIARMTPRSLSVLIATLKDKRAEVVKPLDLQIAFYEDLLKKKEAEQNAKTTS